MSDLANDWGTFLSQQAPGTSPGTAGTGQAADQAASQALADFTRDLRDLQEALLVQLSQDVERLGSEKARLVIDIEQLQTYRDRLTRQRTQALAAPRDLDDPNVGLPLSAGSVDWVPLDDREATRQLVEDAARRTSAYLQALIDRRFSDLEARLVAVGSPIARPAIAATTFQSDYADRSADSSADFSPDPSQTSPSQDPASLAPQEAAIDRLISQLDQTLRATFQTLQNDLVGYERDLNQRLARMQDLQAQGEALLAALTIQAHEPPPGSFTSIDQPWGLLASNPSPDVLPDVLPDPLPDPLGDPVDWSVTRSEPWLDVPRLVVPLPESWDDRAESIDLSGNLSGIPAAIDLPIHLIDHSNPDPALSIDHPNPTDPVGVGSPNPAPTIDPATPNSPTIDPATIDPPAPDPATIEPDPSELDPSDRPTSDGPTSDRAKTTGRGLFLALGAALTMALFNVGLRLLFQGSGPELVLGLFPVSGAIEPGVGNVLLILLIRTIAVLAGLLWLAQRLDRQTWRDLRHFIEHSTWRDWNRLAFHSFWLFLSQVFLYVAIGHSATGVAIGLFFIYPLATLFGSQLLRGRPMLGHAGRRRNLLAIGLILVGLAWILPHGVAIDPQASYGATMALLGGLSFAAYLSFSQAQPPALSPVPTTLLSFGAMFVFTCLSLIGLPNVGRLDLGSIQFDGNLWPWILGSGFGLGLLTLLALWLNHAAVRLAGAVRTARIDELSNGLTMVLAWLLIGESLLPTQVLGIACTSLGIMFLGLRR